MNFDDVVVNKCAALERCLKRIRALAGVRDYTSLSETEKESALLNLQRACENAISLAMYIVRKKNLGIPQSNRESFELLADHAIISKEFLERMKSMIGFRNIAVHGYERLNDVVIENIIRHRLGDFEEFMRIVKQ